MILHRALGQAVGWLFVWTLREMYRSAYGR